MGKRVGVNGGGHVIPYMVAALCLDRLQSGRQWEDKADTIRYDMARYGTVREDGLRQKRGESLVAVLVFVFGFVLVFVVNLN
jgi:hypothetical protein